jgi:hypothetical protein
MCRYTSATSPGFRTIENQENALNPAMHLRHINTLVLIT